MGRRIQPFTFSYIDKIFLSWFYVYIDSSLKVLYYVMVSLVQQ